MLDVHEDLRRSDTLAVAFTGVMDGLGGIPFEFHRSISQSPWAGLFVRDTEKIWYQYDQSSIDALVRAVNRGASEAGATRVVCLGNSMGGFSAILFGRFLRADAVIAFAPQTCIEPTLTDAIGDFRWRQWQETIRSYPQGDLAACDPGPARNVASRLRAGGQLTQIIESALS